MAVDYSEVSLSILGIMTPFEVSKIAKISTGVRKISLIDVMIR